MKINLLRKHNPPVIAYLDESSLQLSKFESGEFRIKKYNFDYNNINSSYKSGFNCSAKSRLIIILSDELLLYSQLKLPLNLSDREVTQLIYAQKSQRQSDSEIQTCYDFFQLQKQQGSAVFGLFEARKDKLDRVIEIFKNQGLVASLVIPQLVVIVNQIISNNSNKLENYHLVCKLNRNVFITEINNNRLVNVNQIHINQTQSGFAINTEIQVYLSEIEAEHIVVTGLDVTDFKSQNHDLKNQPLPIESIGSGQGLDYLSINWMREQYGLYQSIAMA